MSRYKKIEVRIHGDAKFRALSPPQPCGQWLFVYLLTSPLTNCIPGVFRAGAATLAEELGWSMEGFRKAFQEVLSQGLVEADFDARIIFVKNAIKHNQPQSPNVIKSWQSHWEELPECELKTLIYQHLKDYTEGMGKGFREAFEKAITKPMPNQKQYQEQEQKQYQETTFCAETKKISSSAPQPDEPVVRTFPVDGTHENFLVMQSDLEKWQKLYPSLDVQNELTRMWAWLDANPTKRKTRTGMPKFIVNWLNKSQNQGRGNNSSGRNFTGETEVERTRRLIREATEPT